MSTILKALKKLEQDQEEHRTTAQPPIADLNTRQVFNRAVRFAWIKKLGTRWGLIGAAVLAAAAGFSLLQSGVQTPAKKPFADEPRAAAARAPAGQPGRQDLLSAQPGVKNNTADMPQNDQSSPAAAVRSGAPPARQPEPGPTIQTARPVPPKALPATEPAADPGALHQANPSPTPPPAAAQSAHSFAGAKRMTDGRLKVQAIAWSRDVEDRMAVVNNRIVHPGDSVDGFVLLAVEPEHIVVRSEGKTWTVLFGQP